MKLADIDPPKKLCNRCGGSGEVATPTVEALAIMHRKFDRAPFTMGKCPACDGSGNAK